VKLSIKNGSLCGAFQPVCITVALLVYVQEQAAPLLCKGAHSNGGPAVGKRAGNGVLTERLGLEWFIYNNDDPAFCNLCRSYIHINKTPNSDELQQKRFYLIKNGQHFICVELSTQAKN
jgi:hypothetical protein